MRTLAAWMFLCLAQGLVFGAEEPLKTKPKPASLDDELFKELGGEAPLDQAKSASKPGSSKIESAKPSSPKPDSSTADPAKPTVDEPGEAEASASGGAPKPAARPASPKLAPLDAELMRKLDGDAPNETRAPPKSAAGAAGDETSSDPVERLSRLIREAESRIRATDSGRETQRMQGEIVAGLDQLIARLEQRQRQQRSSSGKSPKPGASQPKPQPGPQSPSPGKNPGDRNSDDARDSQEGTRRAENRGPDPAKLKEMLAKVWGTLPERDRQDIMQSSFDDLPPKYRIVIEEYFKRLIERRE